MFYCIVFLNFLGHGDSSGGGDTLSVKSAAVLDHTSHYSEHLTSGDLQASNLSASNPNLDQAGQKAS